MKARPKGHIAVKCGMQKRILKLRQKIVVTDNATPLRFVIIVPIIGKTWCFIYLIPKHSCWRLVFPLTNFQSTFISGAPNNGFLLNTLITPSTSLECSRKLHFFCHTWQMLSPLALKACGQNVVWFFDSCWWQFLHSVLMGNILVNPNLFIWWS